CGSGNARSPAPSASRSTPRTPARPRGAGSPGWTAGVTPPMHGRSHGH
ncbi:MAG: hypothetical protein AVDCRST_MAG19-3727, partial [uncultured Thermomicrobiales bacterium]